MQRWDGRRASAASEGDLDGDFQIVTGMNIITDKPPGKVVAIVHADGQDAVEAFYQKYATELKELFPGDTP